MSDSGGPVRVLVVDDEPNIVDVVSMALRHNGFEVAEAATGATALERVREWHPNVLVLDVMLPDIDGFEVARQLARERAGSRSARRRACPRPGAAHYVRLLRRPAGQPVSG